MKINQLKRCAAAALLLLGMANAASAFNQDQYFLYKTVGGHYGTSGIGVGPDDKIYVAERDGNRMSVYDPDLNLLTRVGGLNYPQDISVSRTGVVYVAEQNAGKVRKFDSAGNSLGELCTGLSSPDRVRIHPGDGTIYVRYGSQHNQYSIYNPDGTLVKSFSVDNNLNSGPCSFDVMRDGKISIARYNQPLTVCNTNGINEQTKLGGSWYALYDIRFANNKMYIGTAWQNYIGVTDMENNGLYTFPCGDDSYRSFYINVNNKGDIVSSNNSANVSLLRRCGPSSMGPEVRNAAPTAEVTSIQQRPNSTLLDIDYTVTDLDDAKVQVAAAAFKNNTNDLSNMVLLNTLVENTAQNVGADITTGASHRLTWDASADWGVDFGDISVHIFARDSRPLLMGLHFLSLPASGTNAAVTLTRSPVHQGWFMEPLMWLAASKNSAVSFANGQIKGVGGAFDGQLLASGSTVTQAGRQYIESLMNVREATDAEVKAAREASTPGNVNQWDLNNLTQKISQTYPQKVNEYGFDTGSYDGNWFWLVKVN